MPLRDGTGPMGMGSMTGRGAGYCTGNSVPTYGRRNFGFGLGRCRGFGRGQRYNRPYSANFAGTGGAPYFDADAARYSAPTQEEERQFLKRESDALQSHLNEIRRRLDELEKEKIQA